MRRTRTGIRGLGEHAAGRAAPAGGGASAPGHHEHAEERARERDGRVAECAAKDQRGDAAAAWRFAESGRDNRSTWRRSTARAIVPPAAGRGYGGSATASTLGNSPPNYPDHPDYFAHETLVRLLEHGDPKTLNLDPQQARNLAQVYAKPLVRTHGEPAYELADELARTHGFEPLSGAPAAPASLEQPAAKLQLAYRRATKPEERRALKAEFDRLFPLHTGKAA